MDIFICKNPVKLAQFVDDAVIFPGSMSVFSFLASLVLSVSWESVVAVDHHVGNASEILLEREGSNGNLWNF